MADKYLKEDSTGYYQLEDGSGVLLTEAGFDYYISPTGSDANPGTLASPWAITAINTKQSTYAGKKLGILPGTYDISAKMAAATYQGAIFQINGGTVGRPTYIGTSDASGNYLAGTATLDCFGASGLYGGGNTSYYPYPIGQTGAGGGTGPQPPNLGNWILDGLNISGFSNWAITVGGYDGTPGQIPNVIIKNCTLHDSVCTYTGTHPAPLIIYRASNVLVSNCYFYNNKNTAADAVHYAGLMIFGSGGPTTGVVVEKCSFINSSCIYVGEDLQSVDNITVRQCYFDMTLAQTNFMQSTALMGFGKAAAGLIPSTINNNIVKGGNLYDMNPTNPSTLGLNIYNNTWDRANGAGYFSSSAGIRVVETVGTTQIFKAYNNLIFDNGATTLGNYGYIAGNVDGFSVLDYNIYGTIANGHYTYAANGGIALGGGGFAAWKTATGKDSNSSVSAVNPFTNNGALALQYQVQSGSPAYQAGKVGGLASGAAVNVGAWDGVVTQIGYVAPALPAITGTVTAAQAETIAATGTETESGTASAGEAQTLVAVGGQRFAGTVSTAESQSAIGFGSIVITGTVTLAQSQTIARPAASLFDSSSKTWDSTARDWSEGDISHGGELFAGTVSGGQGSGTVDGAGSLILGATGTATIGQAETLNGAGSETITGFASMAQGEGVAGAGPGLITGVMTLAQGETVFATGTLTVSGGATLAEAQSITAVGSEVLLPISGTAAGAQSETLDASGVIAVPVTGVCTLGQSETLDASQSVVVHISGGGGGSPVWAHFRRPTITLPAKRPRVVGRASLAQSAHSAGSGAVAYPIIGRAVASSTQTSVGSGNVDNRRPINAYRARMLIALMKAA